MTREEILARLEQEADPAYARFSAGLIPDCPPMLGVRLPILRRMAAGLARDPAGPLAVVALLEGGTFELAMLHGMVLGYAALPDEERRDALERWLPRADNWSLCDSPAAGFRFVRRSPAFWQPWLRNLAGCDREFAARFGLVCLMDHCADTPEGRRLVLDVCREVRCPALYTRLGVAWAVSTVAVREPALGLDFLARDTLDAFTHNKAIQKIRESRRASPALREAAAALKRG